ncbi:MAG: tRNA (guanosine(37)-N1)-methyltransferase TrmD [Chloroflexi bacterium]|nr:tRNA (guanosine(37)-N1)-methyltransferase TrmD [Chloroflexota bacterium]|tara:strand:- start:2729 stop:3463 length:735 start_codon:yes stop_codon:yes gene_type:complete
MRFDVVTLFPEIIESSLNQSILKNAQLSGLINVFVYQLRDWAKDKHKTVDDYPFGGGPGMVMKPEPIFDAVEEIQKLDSANAHVVLMSPQGDRLNNSLLTKLLEFERLLIICGRYEGVDERVREVIVDQEVCVGDVVVSGGEFPALMLIDALSRRIPGVLGAEDALEEESFEAGLLEYPQYTRPAEFQGHLVPEILRSGHHAEIERWRRFQQIYRTKVRRPDLLDSAQLSESEKIWLEGNQIDG